MDPYEKLKAALRDVVLADAPGDNGANDLPAYAPLFRLVEPGETLTVTLTVTRSKEGDSHGPQG